MIRYRIRHITTYTYSEPVSLCQNQAHLTPLSNARQVCESAHVTFDPPVTFTQSWRDFFGNEVHYYTVESPHQRLAVTADSTVDVREAPVAIPQSTPAWEIVRDRLVESHDADYLAAAPFLFESPQIRRLPEARDYAAVSFTPGRPILEATLELTSRIFSDFKFDTSATQVNTTTAEVMRKRRGVCQDFAHLQITCLRSLGLAARYVSGYLLTEPPPGQPKLVGADASHAWCSVFIPGEGWIDFDPTNNTIPGIRHMVIAVGRDYSDVCPIKGIILGGGDHTMSVSVDVAPIVV